MWDAVKRLGPLQVKLLEVLAHCDAPAQPVPSVRWLAALELHARGRDVLDDDGRDLDPSLEGSLDRSLQRLAARDLVALHDDEPPGRAELTDRGREAARALGVAPR